MDNKVKKEEVKECCCGKECNCTDCKCEDCRETCNCCCFCNCCNK